MTLFQVIFGLALVVNVSAFAWSVVGVFRRDARPTQRLNVLKLGAMATAVAELVAVVLTPVPVGRGVAGLAMLLVSMGVFVLCVRVNREQPLSLAYSVDAPQHLQKAGPYRVVRHPFYAAYLLTYLAGLVATARLWFLPFFALMLWIYWDAARTEERKFEQSPLHDAYREYRRRAGMFLPRLWPRRA